MRGSNTVYQLIKIKKDGSEKVIQETQSSCVEKAMDYFYIYRPEAYYSKKYRIGIKPTPKFTLS
jgi:hypothetical protein